MQGAPTIPLDAMLWLSLAALALGLLAMVPVWWSNYRGWWRDPTPEEMRVRAIAYTLTVGGGVGLVGTGVAAAQRNLSTTAFLVLCGVWMALMLTLAFTVDAARGRRRH